MKCSKKGTFDELLDVCDDIIRLKPLKKLSNENERKYRSVNTILRKSMKDTKEKWIQNQCLVIENDMKIGRNSKRAYQVLKNLTNTTQKKSIHIIENKKGILVKDDTEILNRWSEYCKDLYNYQIAPDRNLLSNRISYSEISPPIIKSEVEQAIRSIKKGKAGGVDNIPG